MIIANNILITISCVKQCQQKKFESIFYWNKKNQFSLYRYIFFWVFGNVYPSFANRSAFLNATNKKFSKKVLNLYSCFVTSSEQIMSVYILLFEKKPVEFTFRCKPGLWLNCFMLNCYVTHICSLIIQKHGSKQCYF